MVVPPMNATSSAAAIDPAHHSFWQWNSPLPYLFGSFGIMLVLIAMALIILACSLNNSSSTNDPPDDDLEAADKYTKSENPSATVSLPQILVIMAGNDKPTCLAFPTTSSLPTYPDHLV